MESETFFAGETEDSVFHGVALEGIQVAAADAPPSSIPSLRSLLDTARVVVPDGATVVHVTVTPGEVVALPFGPDAHFEAKEANGNLAIRVGDIVVILEGYVAAQTPPVIETSDGHPLDIATILAATDPNIDIQTAAGPGSEGGQGHDNTGAIFQQLGDGAGGLGGLQGVGGQGDSEGPNGGPGVDQTGNTSHETNTETNAAPVATDVAATTDEDHPVSGTLAATDADGDPLTYSIVGAVPKGVVLGKDGAWSFDPTGNYDALDTGDHATVTFQYEANDGTADSNTATVTIDVTGVNDAPEIVAGLDSIYPTEDASGTFVVRLTVVDPDDGVSPVFTTGAMPTGLSYDPATDKLSFDLAGHYDYLKPGETTDLVVFFQASDGEATSAGWPVTVRISGVNDAAAITGDKSGTVTEDSGVAATGKITVTDLDHDEAHTEAATDVAAKYGTWSVDADGNWSYKLDDSNTDVNKLGPKDTLTDTFTVKSLDGSASQDVTITINGHNDAPVLASTLGSVTAPEDTTADFSLKSSASIKDPDSTSYTYALVGTVPNGLTLDANGIAHIAAGHYDYLAAGEYANFVVSYKVTDDGGADSNILTFGFAIGGANDAATITNTTGDVTEDSGVPATGQIAINDPDHDQSLLQTSGTFPLSYGKLDLNADGSWTYTLDDKNSAVNALGANDTLTETFAVTSLDGTASKDLTLTIHGHNDAPSISSILKGFAASEDTGGSTTQVKDALTITDPDSTSWTYALVGTVPAGLTMDADGTLHFNPAGNYDYLAANEIASSTVSYQVKDLEGALSNVLTFTFAVNGVNDAPVTNNDVVLTNFGPSVLEIPAAALLANDPDPDSPTLSITSLASKDGPVSLSGGNDYVSFAPILFLNPTSFTYAASDGTATGNTATVSVHNQAGGDIHGTAASEILVGNNAGVKLDGGGGKDLIFGGNGDDTVYFHDGDKVDGGGDSVTALDLAAHFQAHGDVLVVGTDLNLTAAAQDGTVRNIETISTQDLAGQTLALDATAVQLASDHHLDPLGVLGGAPVIRLDGDALDQLYLSITRDGGQWASVIATGNGYELFAHEATASDPASVDAYVLVSPATVANVHLNQDAP